MANSIAVSGYYHCGSPERQQQYVDQVWETRPQWNEWPFHYDFRFPIGRREVYLEVVLQDDDPSDPTIHIVSIHDA